MIFSTAWYRRRTFRSVDRMRDEEELLCVQKSLGREEYKTRKDVYPRLSQIGWTDYPIFGSSKKASRS